MVVLVVRRTKPGRLMLVVLTYLFINVLVPGSAVGPEDEEREKENVCVAVNSSSRISDTNSLLPGLSMRYARSSALIELGRALCNPSWRSTSLDQLYRNEPVDRWVMRT
jgi:hypothetical protein